MFTRIKNRHSRLPTDAISVLKKNTWFISSDDVLPFYKSCLLEFYRFKRSSNYKIMSP